MQIDAETRGSVALISLSGSVDALTADEVTSYMEEYVKKGNTRLVADLSNLEYVSSAGLRCFLTVLKSARSAGGDLFLAAAQRNVDKVLSMSGFTSIMKTFPNVDAALAAFGEA